MATFLLIHGGNHVAEHWRTFRPHLEGYGHTTIAPDVPLDRVDAGLDDWVDAIVDSLQAAGSPSDVIAVGHSMGGLSLPLLASRYPVLRMVFLCSLLPVPRTSWNEYLAEHPDANNLDWDQVQLDDQGRLTYPFDFVFRAFYGDCSPEQASSAYNLLVPCATTALAEPYPLDAWPQTASTFILCEDDQLIPCAWVRRVSLEWAGTPALELPGSHSPMLSRPDALAELLDGLAQE